MLRVAISNLKNWASLPFARLRGAVMEGVYPKAEQAEHLAAIRPWMLAQVSVVS